ncbi:MAG TPA: hypothetical protein VIG41_10620 [Micrococcaceae bacterium]
MPIVWQTPGIGSPPPDAIRFLAGQLSEIAERLRELEPALRAAGDIEWRSPGAAAFRGQLQDRGRLLRAAADETETAHADLGQYAAWLESSAQTPLAGPAQPW